ncbi:MAG TPA: hypothetical protein VGB64_06555 [Actinomycetota bacterium]
MNGPAGIMALVLAETAVGGAAVLAFTPLRGRVRHAFYKLTGGVLGTTAVLAFFAARAPLGGFDATGSRAAAFWLLGVVAAIAVVWQVLLWTNETASFYAGYAMIPAGAGAFAALAALPDARSNAILGFFQLAGGAFFLGAVTVGLLLGHWYLVDRKLPGEPLGRVGQYLLAGSVVAAIMAIAGGGGGASATTSLSPLLGAGVLAVAIAVGLAALCTMIAFFIRALVKEGSMQAATGFFYLAVLMGLSAEFAAKIRFY